MVGHLARPFRSNFGTFPSTNDDDALFPLCKRVLVFAHPSVSDWRLGTCSYCGQPAGPFRSKHAECEDSHVRATQRIAELVFSAVCGTVPASGLPAKLQALASQAHLSSAIVKNMTITGWEYGVDFFLNDGNLDSAEQARLVEIADC